MGKIPLYISLFLTFRKLFFEGIGAFHSDLTLLAVPSD